MACSSDWKRTYSIWVYPNGELTFYGGRSYSAMHGTEYILSFRSFLSIIKKSEPVQVPTRICGNIPVPLKLLLEPLPSLLIFRGEFFFILILRSGIMIHFHDILCPAGWILANNVARGIIYREHMSRLCNKQYQRTPFEDILKIYHIILWVNFIPTFVTLHDSLLNGMIVKYVTLSIKYYITFVNASYTSWTRRF